MRRTWWSAVAAAVLLAAVAAASTLPAAKSALSAALQARIAAQGVPAAEAAALQQADAAVPGITGALDPADLAAIGTVAKKIAKSKTTDPPVLAASADLAQCLLAAAQSLDAEIAVAASQIISGVTRTKVQAKLTKAQAIVASVQSQIATDPVGAAARIALLLKNYQKLKNQVATVVANQLPTFPLQRYSSDLVLNNTSRPVIVTGVTCVVHVVPTTSPEFDLTGDITQFGIGSYALPYTVFPTNFYRVDAAVGYAVSDRIGFEFAHYSGTVTLKFKGYAKETFPVSR